jgi:hypothetical protein
MLKPDWSLKLILAAIAACLAILVFQGFGPRIPIVRAEARFDHVHVITSAFLYKGQAGLLILDKRNGNVWFMTNQQGVFGEPVLLTRVPFEKLDQTPQ